MFGYKVETIYWNSAVLEAEPLNKVNWENVNRKLQQVS
jgi:hypothetical protein